MKDFYHICLTAHDEVLLRNPQDARTIINLSALSAYRTDTEVLTDAEMSTHLHNNLHSPDPVRYSRTLKESITKYFNHRYDRRGPLFDPGCHILKLEGERHIQMSLCYGLRQGMHHGITRTPFEYRWSTCNSLFRTERGLLEEKPAFRGSEELKYFLPKNAAFPEDWCADEDGILLRSSFENLSLVQNWFGSCRSFLMAMNRRTSEEWIREQDQEKSASPLVTLDLLEHGFSPNDIKQMAANEGNPKYIQRRLDDMSLCMHIDKDLIKRLGVDSVYLLDTTQKLNLINTLRREFPYADWKQLARCVALKYRPR